MQLQITGNGVEVTSALKDFTEKKLHRVESHSKDILSINVHFQVDKIRQIANATLKLPHHIINAEAESEDMYKTIDLLVDKLLAQLDKYKGKRIDQQHHRS